ncbi:Rv3654c family TadE-like protein [Promicromonospora sp. MEB111]|uniref:Rv3654c family TadE-like protein n=1 Tax=Promicromonospora sp. MEB111 TaxID=3040301 RepID=UPI00255083AF|nr:Rv3654c family TadE-like protein [Promicromonospora sp. MEB111]
MRCSAGASAGPGRDGAGRWDPWPRRAGRCRLGSDPERGAGTVLVLGIVAGALLLAVGIAALGAAQNARGTAQAAADLGAIAGATALRDGFDPCGTAGAAVVRNGATVASCEVLGGGVVRVVATRAAAGPVGEFGGALGQARATARAGPREKGMTWNPDGS